MNGILSIFKSVSMLNICLAANTRLVIKRFCRETFSGFVTFSCQALFLYLHISGRHRSKLLCCLNFLQNGVISQI